MTQVRAYRDDNRLRIVCPIFNSPSELRGCIGLRDAVYRGDKPAERRGCQAAMCDGKCPVENMIRRAYRDASEFADLYSVEEKTVSLDRGVVARIAPVLVQDRTLDRYGVPSEERAALLASNNMARSEGAPKKSAPLSAKFTAPPRRKSEAPVEAKPETDVLIDSIGADMGSLVNALVEKEKASVVEAPTEAPPAPVASAPPALAISADPPKRQASSGRPKPPMRSARPTESSPGRTMSLMELARQAKGQSA